MRDLPHQIRRLIMLTTSPPTLIAVILTILLAGCSTAPKRELSAASVPFASLPNGHDPLNPTQFVSAEYKEYFHDPARQGVIRYYERKHGRALNILEISGGGQNGAFGAGVLKGWRESGKRPQFDIVSGVSAGALLATHAFLGTPADDAVLEQLFTQIDDRRIYKHKNLLGLLFGSNSVFDTAPLAALLAEHITPEVLQRVSAAYDDNRRLWVGTTNLDYHQTWVWNMTLIAKEGALELYRQVLRASASPPLAFPPVQIKGHLFADGVVRANAVAIGLAGEEPPGPPPYGPGTVYVIHNGKRNEVPAAVRNDIIDIAGDTVSTSMAAAMQAVLLRSYAAAGQNGYRFRLVDIPIDAAIGKNALAFDPEEMRAAFAAGEALGRDPDAWLDAPPIFGDIPGWELGVLRGLANPARRRD